MKHQQQQQQQQWAWSTGKPETPGALSVRLSTDTEGASSGGIKFNLPKKQWNQTEDTSPAYISVASKPAGSSAPAPSGSAWPPSLKNYVNRAFAMCATSWERDRTEGVLRSLIQEATAAGTLHTKDWTSQPLPQIGSKSAIGDEDEESEEEQPTRKKKKKGSGDAGLGDLASEGHKQNRAARFAADFKSEKKPGKKSKNRFVQQSDGDDYASKVTYEIKGTCTDLEKDYFRLTSAPAPSTVRPEHVLKQSLEHVVKKHKQDGDYKWACNQLKSIRQDLTVQHIHNALTVEVYETHARMAIQHQDSVEFHQCQAQLIILYDKELPGHVCEFLAYRILYYLHSNNTRDMITLISELTAEQERDESVAHALAVCEAYSVGDYHTLFKLYTHAPNLSRRMMDFFTAEFRLQALITITIGFRPEVEAAYVQSELGFEDKKEFKDFLVLHNAVKVSGKKPSMIDCKLTYQNLMAS